MENTLKSDFQGYRGMVKIAHCLDLNPAAMERMVRRGYVISEARFPGGALLVGNLHLLRAISPRIVMMFPICDRPKRFKRPSRAMNCPLPDSRRDLITRF